MFQSGIPRHGDRSGRRAILAGGRHPTAADGISAKLGVPAHGILPNSRSDSAPRSILILVKFLSLNTSLSPPRELAGPDEVIPQGFAGPSHRTNRMNRTKIQKIWTDKPDGRTRLLRSVRSVRVRERFPVQEGPQIMTCRPWDSPVRLRTKDNRYRRSRESRRRVDGRW
jgi:hypothetical protein